ncbi:unnamed protein product [Linum tenue]|uniref:Uncharacterized protein n=1 Tax=Linum tenue TaxID=586396 RepID=A0AAV0LIF6_9ROSI|nr:unnamed protein product [Linum tenue]
MAAGEESLNISSDVVELQIDASLSHIHQRSLAFVLVMRWHGRGK